MNKSDSIKNLSGALTKAQAEFTRIDFDAVNPFLKNKYASLGAIIEHSRAVLAKYGLSVSQPTVSVNGEVGVTTILMHESGEWMESTITLALADEKGKSSAQVAGSVITYLRRYSLASILNLYSDEDTDGEQPKKAKPQPVNASMTLEYAENVTGGSDNKRYGDCTDKELEDKRLGLVKILNNKESTPEALEQAKLKLDAVNVILESRK